MSEESIFEYDRVVYPTYLHNQTHPDRLATMSSFFGVDPKPIEKCRVLELGCATGTSLLSFAFDLPGSEFIGIDLSEKQIELGNLAVEGVGLKNLTLLHGDIMQVTREKFGEFDYIIAHGLYSWVPEPVRDQILKICRETLAEKGVAFVSYNALPGCHFRQIMREMMLFHSQNFASPLEKVTESLGLIKFIADSASPKVYQSVVQYEFKDLSERNFENIYHDDLTEFNHPVYFHEFMAHAERHDLQFVTEVEHFTTQDENQPKEVLDVLEGISKDKLVLEQYLDFLTGCRFRQTLLCHKELKLQPLPDHKVLRDIRIASPIRPASKNAEFATTKQELFVGLKTEKIEIIHPLTKAAFSYLGQIWGRSTTFPELIEASRQILNNESGTDYEITENDEQILTEILFKVFCTGVIRLRLHEPTFTTEVSERPLASPIARWQAQHGASISTLLCTSIIIQDNLRKQLVKLLDGTRDRRRLLSELTEFINSEDFDQPSEIKKNILRDLPEQLEKNLTDFAHMTLLIS